MNIQPGAISLVSTCHLQLGVRPGNAVLSTGHMPAPALCPRGHVGRVLIWVLGWVEVVVMVVVVVLMVVMVFMPLDHRHHVALGP